MAQHEVHKTIARIDLEIQSQNTGTPIELAGRLCMSVRMLYFYMDMMTSLGADISFCKTRNSFMYKNAGYFQDGIRWVVQSNEKAV